jgi:hypothetical protein
VFSSFSLQAFGAELALKNTEYKVLNDEPTASSTTESSAPSTTPTSNAHTMDTVFFGQSLNQSAWKSRHQAAQQSVRAVLQKQKVRAMPTKNDDEEKV